MSTRLIGPPNRGVVSLVALATALLMAFTGILRTTNALGQIVTKQKTVKPEKYDVCTKAKTAACAECSGTEDVYQCKPAALPTGVVYGSCVKRTNADGTCVVGGSSDIPTQTCGNSDWDCATPSETIDKSFACSQDEPKVCKTKK